jgi:hypothetical protein
VEVVSGVGLLVVEHGVAQLALHTSVIKKHVVIRQCCGSRRFIPDPGSEFFASWIRIFCIPDPGSASKNLSILTQKIVSKLSEI